ncbi:MAG: TetM/TetW/TetO/TetS family tetracycline resistance ribosomal protection protein [Defluviitaleaceae bacterium]|nr:TetM/TetW/TetO/TetS family tetracycline resistance ribosomal protection protein [Defluviitaleaceae bacterium]
MKKLNIGIIAHVDAGKTTLTENILFLGGIITQAGRVDKGNTRTDSMAVERRRGISVRAAATSFNRNGIKFNLIDTPGHVDFVAEVERSLTILDGVVLVISAKEGLQSQTRILMDTIKTRQIPTVIYINKIDRVGADIAQVIKDTNDYMGGRLVTTQRIDSDGNIHDFTMEELVETAADTLYIHDDNLMTRFANNDEITPSDFMDSFIHHTNCGNLYPVFFGSALYGIGVENLLDSLPRYLPIASADNDSQLEATVFKVDNSGKERLVYVRLYSGSISIRKLVNYRGKTKKIARLAALVDGKLVPANTIESGDIAVLYLKDLMVGDMLGEGNAPTRSIRLGQPTINVEVVPVNQDERRALYDALVLMADEDPLLGLSAEHSLTVRLFGEVQMEILQEILAERYAIATTLTTARTIYMETPTQPASAKILFGRTFFRAGVGISIKPLPRGSGVIYESAVSLGELEKSFQTAVEEAVYSTCQNGLYGWEITDIQVVFDYSDYDSVTSTPASYRDLVPLVMMNALKDANVTLLEPIMDFELNVPDTSLPKAMYDLQLMNAYGYNTSAIHSDIISITGHIPADTCRGYGAKVGSYTEGRGNFITKFHGYSNTEFAEDKVNQNRINAAANAGLYAMQKLGAR